MKVLRSIKKDAFTHLAIPKDIPKSATSKETAGVQNVAEVSSCSTSHSNSSISKTTIQIVLKLLSEQVVISEIHWAMYVVYHHHSLRSSGGMAALFQEMFPDSSVAQEFSVSSAKLSYLINHGLASYFKAEILNELTPKCPRFSVKFVSALDESFNRVSTTKQMDALIIYYFDKTSSRVKRVYLNSQFMGHATVSDVMEDFKKTRNGLDFINNLVQLPMDGPNVNWAFLEELEKYRKLENLKVPSLIVLGSCELHVVHGAHKTGQQQTIGTWRKT